MTEPSNDFAVKINPIRKFLSRLKTQLMRLRRRWLPYLVWYNYEVDVTVTLLNEKLDPKQGMESFYNGYWRDIQDAFHKGGVSFDSGIGPDGRDWEWDWSLRGPISVRFRSRAKRPELRGDRSAPKLIINNAQNSL